MEDTTQQVRPAPNPTGKGGFGDNPQNINPGGRPANSMKAYLARKLAEMDDLQKEEFLKAHRVTGKDQIEFGEGKATSDVEFKGDIVAKIISVDE